MKHVNITIFGRVQGVGFRWATMNKAKSFGVTGFVKNLDNGSLYIEAEGENDQLEKFITWCRKGPLWAKVANIEISDGTMQNFSFFTVK